ncbi:MAG: DUF502 domain-containing protein [Thermoplasmatota archaeon]
MKFKKFLWTTLIGGLGVLLPLVILGWAFYWLYTVIVNMVRPLSEPISDLIGLDLPIVDIIVLGSIFGACFLLGLLIRTRIGNFFHRQVENNFLKKIPGYTVTKEVILHFSGEEETPFSSVVLVKPFGNETLMTGFVTDRNPTSPFTTVFVPTGPNPTSGNIYHVRNEDVLDLKAKVELGIKTVIGCGAGSKVLLNESSEIRG